MVGRAFEQSRSPQPDVLQLGCEVQVVERVLEAAALLEQTGIVQPAVGLEEHRLGLIPVALLLPGRGLFHGRLDRLSRPALPMRGFRPPRGGQCEQG